MPGVSIAPAFAKDGALTRDTLFFSHEGNKALRVGDYKMVSAKRDGGTWELYNMATDRGEQKNLAQVQSKRVQTMATIWEALDNQFAKDSGASEKLLRKKKQ